MEGKMKLRRVEIQGFKSFADRTVIKFDGDVVAIVGPNGCGKSNIADAIRWAMGEQSSKRLRMQEMEDVIFSGSDTRGPMSMAEVSLYFENHGGIDYPAYRDLEEIVITRRYYHSGENEYFINDVPCRLKDVVELLSGSGVSSKIYSVIEQGRIGWIVSSRPEDKRQIIEDAAGVSVYKSRIASIERKNEKTVQNLLRISDIIKEMEVNLSQLRRQAHKAARFKEYQDTLMDLELHRASFQYLNLIREKAKIEKEMESIKMEKDSISVKISIEEGEMEKLKLELVGMEEKFRDLQRQYYEAQNEFSMNESFIERGVNDVKNLKKKYGENLVEREKLKVKRESLRGEIQNKFEKGASLTDLLAKEGEVLKKVEKELEAIKSKQAEIQKIYDGNGERLLSLLTRIATFQAKREEAEKIFEEMNIRIPKMKEEEDVVHRKFVLLDDELRKKWVEKKEIHSQYELIMQERSKILNDIENHKREIATLDEELSAVEEKVMSAKTMIHNFEEELKKIASRQEVSRNLCGELSSHLLSEKIECDAGFERAVWAILKEYLDCVVVGDMDIALGWHISCQKRGLGETGFIARRVRKIEDKNISAFIDTVPQNVEPLRNKVRSTWDVTEILDRLLEDVFVVPNMEMAVALCSKVRRDVTFVTPEGLIVTSNGAILIPGIDVREEEEARLKSQIMAHRRKYEELVSFKESLTLKHEEAKKKIQTGMKNLDEITSLMHEREKDILRKEKEIETSLSELENLRNILHEISNKIEELSDKRAEMTNDVKGMDEELVALQDEVSVLEKEQEEILSKMEELRSEIEKKMILKGSSASTLDNLKKQYEQCELDIRRLESELDEFDERYTTMEREIEDSLIRQGKILAEIYKSGELLDQLRDTVKSVSNDMDEVRTKINDGRFKLSEKESIVRTMKKEMEEKDERIFALKSDFLRVESDIERISENVNLRWRRKLEDVVYDYHTRKPPDKDIDEKIEEITRICDRMGPVNLLAIEDYKKAEEKYQFYVKEKADLEESIEKFKQAISKLNREYKRKFLEAFEAVNNNFKRLFPILFCGGHGYLELLDPQNVLESGVEIKAQPPGKKVGNLEMMSGGEKALTAIALIFSVFGYRPSPFCILDEVDSPLDEANVSRFNELLRTMTNTSQFILMTHSKLTMQNADILYGVTMEEPGISRIISTKIQKPLNAPDRITTAAA